MKRTVTPVQSEKTYKVEHPNGPNYGKTATGVFNEKTMEFISNRFCVFRNFIPREMIDTTMDVWKTIEECPKMIDAIFDQEIEPIPNSPDSSKNTSKGGHTTPMGVAMHRWVHKKLANEFDINLETTYSYTRKYDRGAYLKAHCDRPSCEVSATICTGYETDDGEPWVIWVDNSRNWVEHGQGDQKGLFDATQGVPIRQRKGIPIKLEVGDLLLYQGPNVIHWRDYLLGNFSYHMFLHFHAKGVSNLQSLAAEGADFWWQAEGRFVESNYLTALYNDGRSTPYRQVGDPRDKEYRKHFDEFMKLYEACPNKSSYVNNYDHLVIEEKKEK